VQGTALALADLEPWPEPVEGAVLLRDIADTISRYVSLPPHAADAMALWAIHAHSLNTANVAPILALISPTKRCGKTRTLSLIRQLVPRPILASSISPAALFRAVEKFSPTLLIDEMDTTRENEELRCILNSSHTRHAAYVVRTVGDQHEPRQFSTWAAKAVALIGRLPETLADRSIIVPMRRRGPGESVERLRLDRPAAFLGLHRRAARWAADHLDELTGRDPEAPKELNDRAADNWRPLLAIADAAGGEWPEQARSAALALSGEAPDSEDSIRELLLADIWTVFRERHETRLFSDDLVVALCQREERPWSDWKNGHPLSPVQLARLVKPFGVRPRQMRVGTKTGKGYEPRDFADAFTRYLPPSDPSQPSQSNADADLTDLPTRHSLGSVTGRENGPNPCRTGFVKGVTAQAPSPQSETGEWDF
jgi:putative DNA primase/helicase